MSYGNINLTEGAPGSSLSLTIKNENLEAKSHFFADGLLDDTKILDKPGECRESTCSLRLRGGGDMEPENLSMSEKDIRDTLFEAGYSIEAIKDIMAAKEGINNSSSTTSSIDSALETSSIESEVTEADTEGDSAFDVLKE